MSRKRANIITYSLVIIGFVIVLFAVREALSGGTSVSMALIALFGVAVVLGGLGFDDFQYSFNSWLRRRRLGAKQNG